MLRRTLLRAVALLCATVGRLHAGAPSRPRRARNAASSGRLRESAADHGCRTALTRPGPGSPASWPGRCDGRARPRPGRPARWSTRSSRRSGPIADPAHPARGPRGRRAPPAGGLPRARDPARLGRPGPRRAPPGPGAGRARQRRRPARVPLDAPAGAVGPERRAARLADRAARAGPDAARGYREAERRFGVDWDYLAAINLVETGLGRIRGTSVAGAQGPMQFIPSTWDIYGEGRHQLDAHDSILAAGRFLRDQGLHRAGRPRGGALPLQQLHGLRARGDPAAPS